METLRSLLLELKPGLPLVLTLAGIAVTLFLTRLFYERRSAVRSGQRLQQQLAMLTLTFVGTLLVVLAAPLKDSQKGQLISLIGLLVSAAIALSSTTFLGNAMAGVMLRVVRSFRTGDFIRVGDHFGRVSERGLFHTEIQTEDRDLMALPNLYLATNPVKVIRSSGTIISVRLSLGYDVSRTRIEDVLVETARTAGLTDPFVHIMELQDFSVVYQVAGLLEDVKGVLSARSRLRETVLDGLHTAGIEIVSPNFMNTRAVGEERHFIPPVDPRSARPEPLDEPLLEQSAFDKAEEAESLEFMQVKHADLGAKIAELEKELKEATEDSAKEELGRRIERKQRARRRLEALLKKKVEE